MIKQKTRRRHGKRWVKIKIPPKALLKRNGKVVLQNQGRRWRVFRVPGKRSEYSVIER